MVSHLQLVITVLPGDENQAIKNYLEENMTISKTNRPQEAALKHRIYFRFVC